MADGYVQVPADDVGKKIDTSEITRQDGVVVERQKVTIGDSTYRDKFVDVRSNELAVGEETARHLLVKILEVLEDIRLVLWQSSR